MRAQGEEQCYEAMVDPEREVIPVFDKKKNNIIF
jgi:hypothetical protein